MIVNYTESGWQIITQRSHSLLAAQICGHWKKDNQPSRWVDTLIATAEHDDVYNEFVNDNLLNDKGGPVNFKNTDFELPYAERLIAMAETKSAYIALLVSRHIQFLYNNNPKAEQYIRNLKIKEKSWLKFAGTTNGEINRSYKLLEFCDAFSLLICQGLVPPEQRKIEISSGPDGSVYEMHSQGKRLIVAPWPFETSRFFATYESRTLSALTFQDTADFRQAVEEAETVTHLIEIAGN
ncbi:DUF3891 family protein [Pedobacter hartonius]|uniref:DUF3891 domain-containing protein n=1 Tax=Pedobacter hartonius TaxID=425514 RepID=A0A1H4CSJ5_9SPHI|nr:DUF3891 family protein [Pedobacter hartonius]SEA63082.1 Protein of unknown function [Pedobacter hartonius]